MLVCLRTCETLFEGSLCLATLIDASWPGAGRRVERLTKRGENGCGAAAPSNGRRTQDAARSYCKGHQRLGVVGSKMCDGCHRCVACGCDGYGARRRRRTARAVGKHFLETISVRPRREAGGVWCVHVRWCCRGSTC